MPVPLLIYEQRDKDERSSEQRTLGFPYLHGTSGSGSVKAGAVDNCQPRI